MGGSFGGGLLGMLCVKNRSALGCMGANPDPGPMAGSLWPGAGAEGAFCMGANGGGLRGTLCVKNRSGLGCMGANPNPGPMAGSLWPGAGAEGALGGGFGGALEGGFGGCFVGSAASAAGGVTEEGWPVGLPAVKAPKSNEGVALDRIDDRIDRIDVVAVDVEDPR